MIRSIARAGGFLAGVVALPILLASADAASEGVACANSPITYDVAAFPSDLLQTCEVEITSAANYDAMETQMPALFPFTRLFNPRGWQVYTTKLAGDFQQYTFLFLSGGADSQSLADGDIESGIETASKLLMLTDQPGGVQWHGEAEIAGYDVRFYRQGQPTDELAAECLFFLRYLDGTAQSHKGRIAGYYCNEEAQQPLDNAFAENLVSAIRYRPELVK